MSLSLRRPTVAFAALTALGLALTACGTPTPSDTPVGSNPPASDGATSAPAEGTAPAEGLSGNLTVWAWDQTITPVAEAFMKANPDVKVEVVNAGTGNDQYTALQNAITAGSGGPDVAQIEYFALGQFALQANLADLSQFGGDQLKDTFTPGPWNAVTQGGTGVFGLPLDSGPMALFYNEELFTKHNIEVPETWEQYLEAARALHAADPKVYMTNDTGDAGFTTSMIWQAGGKPYTVDGTTVKVDFSDEGSKKFADLWTNMLKEELVAPISSWSDEWFKGLGNGTIATLTIGAWMPGNMVTGAPEGAGKWRVAPMPVWNAGDKASAENGGSSIAVMEKSPNKELAAEFVKFASAGDGVAIRIEGGAFPSTTADLADPEFLGTEFEYFGGQKANEIFADSANNVVEGWTYLPFQVYANSIFNDHVGKSYADKGATTIEQGLQAWGEASKQYGQQQGFTVN